MAKARALLASMMLSRVRESFMFALMLRCKRWCCVRGIEERIAGVVCCLMANDFEAEVALYKYLIPPRLVRKSIILWKQASTECL
jgi:hypothetical protein